MKYDKKTILHISAVTAATCIAFGGVAISRLPKEKIEDHAIGTQEMRFDAPADEAGTQGNDPQVSGEDETADEAVIEDNVLVRYGGGDADAFIPENVTAVGSGAFTGKDYVKTIHIHENVVSIGQGAFDGCEGLTDIYYKGSRAQWYLIDIKGLIPENAALHFEGETLMDPDFIVDEAGTLKSYKGSDTDVTVPAYVTAIAANAFENKDIKSVTLPAGVRRINDKAFEFCMSLESIDLSEGLETVGAQAFYGCTALRSIALPSSVKSIGSMAFMLCGSLDDVTLGSGLISIGNEAFSKCHCLEQLTIPAGVRSIGSDVFDACPVSLCVGEDSTALDYAEENGIAYTVAGSAAQVSAPEPEAVSDDTVTAADGEEMTDAPVVLPDEPFVIPQMPDEHIYTVTVPENVTVIREDMMLENGSPVSAGDVLFIKAVAPAGKELRELTVCGKQTENGSEFIAGNEDVVIEAVFAPKNGTLSVGSGVTVIRDNKVLTDKDTLFAGDVIYIKAVAPEGEELVSLTLNGELIENGTSFVSDGSAAAVDAVFSAGTAAAGEGSGITLDASLYGTSGRTRICTRADFFGEEAVISLYNSRRAYTAALGAVQKRPEAFGGDMLYAFEADIRGISSGDSFYDFGGYVTFDIPVPDIMAQYGDSISVYRLSGSVAVPVASIASQDRISFSTQRSGIFVLSASSADGEKMPSLPSYLAYVTSGSAQPQTQTDMISVIRKKLHF